MAEHKHDDSKKHSHHHHILPDKLALGVGAALLFLTWVTVWVAGIDFGRFNLIVALAVATTKALLVCLFFMNLLYDKRENGVIFGTSFLFLAIFIVLAGSDFYFRGDVYVKEFFAKQPLLKAATGGAPKFKQPWVSKPELVALGKEQFNNQCASCHGEAGLGNGPAAGSLNPKPRNFAATDGWKNGRKVADLYKTLTNGVGGMPAFGSLPVETRFALSHYVQTLYTAPVAASTDAELAAVGINTKDETGGASQQRSVPVNVVIDQMVREARGG
jgi:caa(3)-type oxidase subunit IV